MNVKKSIVILTVIAVFIILMAVFAVVSFPIADTVYDYNGYATTIKLGLDLSGGVSAVFNVVPDDYGDLEARVDGTVSSLQSLLVSEGDTEATVTKTQSGGNFSMRITDNGIPPKSEPVEGGGLSSIRRKVGLFDGSVRVETKPRFVLSVFIPGGETL